MNPEASENDYKQKVSQAVLKALEWGDRIPMGVFMDYQTETYDQKLQKLVPAYGKRNYVMEPIDSSGKPLNDVTKLMDSFC